MAYIGKKPTDKPLTSADLADNIVTSAKIVDGTIADADVNDVAATKLTGTIADARFPATLPTASGANLTSLPAANLTGTVADARISTLTASKLTGALPAISGANLTGVQGSTLTTEGATFANYNTITATVASVLASGKNHFLCGTVTVNSPYVWTITGEPLTFL
jgi:hypothetical protein